MVVEAGEKLHLFGVGAMVDGIVKDEHVNAIRMSQGSERVIDDGGGNLSRESAPVDSARVHEAVERILAKRHSGALEMHQIRQAILFGSYGKGTATKMSDVDLLVDSHLRGLQFIGFVEELREALDDKDMDVFDIKHIEPKSRIA